MRTLEEKLAELRKTIEDVNIAWWKHIKEPSPKHDEELRWARSKFSNKWHARACGYILDLLELYRREAHDIIRISENVFNKTEQELTERLP